MESQTNTDGFDAKYDIIDTTTPRNTQLSARYKRSFAYYTLRERLPVILTQIIDHMNRDKDEIAMRYQGDETREEIKFVVGLISKLKYQLQTDKKFELFAGNAPDKELWNVFITQLPPSTCSFFQSCWLYAECYVYRKVYSFIEGTTTMKGFDYFAKQKEQILKEDSVFAVSKISRNTIKDFKTFDHIIKLNLLGNKCDLSIVLPKDLKLGDNVLDHLDSFNSKILVNDSKLIWECLQSADATKPVIVEFVTDNAGFELFTDLILADYLIEKQLASKVRFSVKPIPWFVSDIGPNDVTWTLTHLSKHQSSYVRELAATWKKRFDEGVFVISPEEYFWVSPYEFFKMREIAPNLYKYLCEAHLVIFKGDLNYRKLLGDTCWDPTEDFITCIRGFLPANFCSLRTIKSDLVCGLPQGKAEELQRLDSQWMISGEYGLIHFMDKKSCDCLEMTSST